MSSTEHKINDTVWVLTPIKRGGYKLPAAGKLKAIDKSGDRPKYSVSVNGKRAWYPYVYGRELCFETALVALKTAENTLGLLRSIYAASAKPQCEEMLALLTQEESAIKEHIHWAESCLSP